MLLLRSAGQRARARARLAVFARDLCDQLRLTELIAEATVCVQQRSCVWTARGAEKEQTTRLERTSSATLSFLLRRWFGVWRHLSIVVFLLARLSSRLMKDGRAFPFPRARHGAAGAISTLPDAIARARCDARAVSFF